MNITPEQEAVASEVATMILKRGDTLAPNSNFKLKGFDRDTAHCYIQAFIEYLISDGAVPAQEACEFPKLCPKPICHTPEANNCVRSRSNIFPTIQSLIVGKMKDVVTIKEWAIYTRNGNSRVIKGSTINEAVANDGIGAIFIDHHHKYSEAEGFLFRWESEIGRWVSNKPKVSEVTGQG